MLSTLAEMMADPEPLSTWDAVRQWLPLLIFVGFLLWVLLLLVRQNARNRAYTQHATEHVQQAAAHMRRAEENMDRMEAHARRTNELLEQLLDTNRRPDGPQ